MSRTLAWVALGLFWIGQPLFLESAPARWCAHLGAVVLAGLSLLPRIARTPSVRVGVPFLAVALALASLAIASQVHPQVFPRLERWWGALTGSAHALLFLLTFALVPRPQEPDAAPGRLEERRARRALVVLLVGMLGAQVLTLRGFEQDGGRLEGSLGSANALGALAAAVVLAAAAFARWRPWVLFALLPSVGLVLATRSRGSAAAGAVVLLVFLTRRSLRSAAWATLALGVLLLVVPNPLRERLESLQEGHAYSRPFLWRAALLEARENPLGIGPSMTKEVFPRRALDSQRPWLVHQRHAVGLTHNVFLTILLEWGWLAGAAAVGLTLWSAARLLPRRPPDPLGQGASLGAAVLLLQMQVDGLEQNAVVLSLALVLAGTALRRPPADLSGVVVSGRLAATGVLVACVALGSQVARRADHALRLDRAAAAVAAHGEGRLPRQAALAILAEVEAELPDEPLPPRVRFELELAGLRERVLEDEAPGEPLGPGIERAWLALVRARSLDPLDIRLLQGQADFLRLAWRQAGGGEEAATRFFAALEDLLRVDPYDVGARYELALESRRAALPGVAEAHLDALFAIEPDQAMAWVTRAHWMEADGRSERALYCWVRAEEAVYNARIKAAVDSPRSRDFYEGVLDRADLLQIRLRIAALRKQLYL